MNAQYRTLLTCLSFIFFTSAQGTNEVLIVTHVFNRPDLIALHKKTFDAFLQDQYKYVVFNDAPTVAMAKEVNKACIQAGATCLRVPQTIHQKNGAPSHAYAESIQYAFDTLLYRHEGIVAMIESDMFLIKPFSIINYLQNYDLIGCKQLRIKDNIHITYTLPALVLLNMKTAPNKHSISFLCNAEGVATDTGGRMHSYIKNNPTLRYRLFEAHNEARLSREPEQLRTLGFDDLCIEFLLSLGSVGKYLFEFHADNHFLHYVSGGSNWRKMSPTYLQEKDTLLHTFIDHSIDYYNQ
jgi:hypothetical protein